MDVSNAYHISTSVESLERALKEVSRLYPNAADPMSHIFMSMTRNGSFRFVAKKKNRIFRFFQRLWVGSFTLEKAQVMRDVLSRAEETVGPIPHLGKLTASVRAICDHIKETRLPRNKEEGFDATVDEAIGAVNALEEKWDRDKVNQNILRDYFGLPCELRFFGTIQAKDLCTLRTDETPPAMFERVAEEVLKRISPINVDIVTEDLQRDAERSLLGRHILALIAERNIQPNVSLPKELRRIQHHALWFASEIWTTNPEIDYDRLRNMIIDYTTIQSTRDYVSSLARRCLDIIHEKSRYLNVPRNFLRDQNDFVHCIRLFDRLWLKTE